MNKYTKLCLMWIFAALSNSISLCYNVILFLQKDTSPLPKIFHVVAVIGFTTIVTICVTRVFVNLFKRFDI